MGPTHSKKFNTKHFTKPFFVASDENMLVPSFFELKTFYRQMENAENKLPRKGVLVNSEKDRVATLRLGHEM